MLGIVLVVLARASFASVIVVDNFNSYTSGSYIQQQNTAWSRFGGATTDGIYSIAGGYQGRGAEYDVKWTGSSGSTTQGFVRYTFSSAQNLSSLTSILLELKVNTAVTGTAVAIQIGSGTPGSGPSYQSNTPLSLTNTAYQDFSFSTLSSDMHLISGSASYASVLSAVTSITFFYSNVNGGAGTSQKINFDDFVLTTASVPEPSVAVLGLTGLLLIVGYSIRRRRQVS